MPPGQTPRGRCLVSKLFDVCSKSTLVEMEKKEEIRIPWGTGIVGYVAESGEPVNIPDAYQVSWLSFLCWCGFRCSFVCTRNRFRSARFKANGDKGLSGFCSAAGPEGAEGFARGTRNCHGLALILVGVILVLVHSETLKALNMVDAESSQAVYSVFQVCIKVDFSLCIL